MTFKLRIIPAGVLAEIGLRAGRTPQRVLIELAHCTLDASEIVEIPR